MAPEVLNKTGHGKAVDIWSTGCVFFFFLFFPSSSFLFPSSPPSSFLPSLPYIYIYIQLTKLPNPTSIITYVLLCGYSPFRSEDTKELIRETTEAKIEFHERYWKNVSVQAKQFIRDLLNPDPGLRPAAEVAFGDPVRWGFFLSFFFGSVSVFGFRLGMLTEIFLFGGDMSIVVNDAQPVDGT